MLFVLRCNRWLLGRAGPACILAVAAAITVTLFATGTLEAQPSVPTVRHVVVTLNKSRTIYIESAIRTATIASTAIADLTPMTDHTLYIQGKKVGTTNISVFDQNMQLVEVIDLEVAVDTGFLQQRIRATTGSRSIRVSTSNGTIILSGMAPDAVAADKAASVAKSMVPAASIVNAMTVAPSQQVMLKVRFLEASRRGGRELGINWFGTTRNGTRGFSTGLGFPTQTNAGGVSVLKSGGALLSGGEPFGVVLANLVNGASKSLGIAGIENIDVLISALEQKGLIRRLAEPNLIALSGDTARFLAGGEFPVPIAVATTTGQGVTPTIEFKKFGVSLAFTPTVLNHQAINLRIAPEVSELDFTNSVTISGTTIPSLVTRNAQTTIELRDGQSFAIAGLLQSRGIRDIQQLPWVGSVPVLGTLFRSSSYQNLESDLVIIVTPHLIQPTTPSDQLATPLDKRVPSNDVDFFLFGETEVPKRYSDYVTSGGNLKGPYGHIIAVEKGPAGAVSDVYKDKQR